MKKEAKNINKYLTVLGMVINTLTEKDKEHFPYRDSKLTRLLQESLGGNSQTSLILDCLMCSSNDKETVDTLRFGYRAKCIKNTSIVNTERSVKKLTILLGTVEKKECKNKRSIQSLQQQLATGVYKSLTDIPVKTKSLVKEEIQHITNKLQRASTTTNLPPAAPNSLTVFKNQMELMKLKEQIEEFTPTNIDLENGLSSKNQEIYDLNGKILQYKNHINELINKITVVEE